MGIPGGSDGKASPCNARDWGSIPGSGRSPGDLPGNPLRYSCLENRMNRGGWSATAHGVAKSQTRLKWHAQGDCWKKMMTIYLGLTASSKD